MRSVWCTLGEEHFKEHPQGTGEHSVVPLGHRGELQAGALPPRLREQQARAPDQVPAHQIRCRRIVLPISGCVVERKPHSRSLTPVRPPPWCCDSQVGGKLPLRLPILAGPQWWYM
ncbi:hypothetical protein NDU88_005395 [Pleurodeles waltl]|uniref:Uncharacterized protein n=1 Tax=Pleurodeles waltl TaxID=8319 RepID=A0AAV7MCQ7_PLEWA|nr:hypothetical protein NDU88_005395 [Pleurodeles waltl]